MLYNFYIFYIYIIQFIDLTNNPLIDFMFDMMTQLNSFLLNLGHLLKRWAVGCFGVHP